MRNNEITKLVDALSLLVREQAVKPIPALRMHALDLEIRKYPDGQVPKFIEKRIKKLNRGELLRELMLDAYHGGKLFPPVEEASEPLIDRLARDQERVGGEGVQGRRLYAVKADDGGVMLSCRSELHPLGSGGEHVVEDYPAPEQVVYWAVREFNEIRHTAKTREEQEHASWLQQLINRNGLSEKGAQGGEGLRADAGPEVPHGGAGEAPGA